LDISTQLYICLFCNQQGKDKKRNVGDKSGFASLTTHLNTHPNESAEYNKGMVEAENRKKGISLTQGQTKISYQVARSIKEDLRCNTDCE
jgi:hypothetical protein